MTRLGRIFSSPDPSAMVLEEWERRVRLAEETESLVTHLPGAKYVGQTDEVRLRKLLASEWLASAPRRTLKKLL